MLSDTRAKLTETFDDDEEDENVPVSKLRRQAASVTLADDERYAGKKITRKDLDQSSEDDSFSDEGEEDNVEENQGETSQQIEGPEDDFSDDNLMERYMYTVYKCINYMPFILINLLKILVADIKKVKMMKRSLMMTMKKKMETCFRLMKSKRKELLSNIFLRMTLIRMLKKVHQLKTSYVRIMLFNLK